MKVGFIGLGKMGGGLARNLIRSGYEVTVFDINEEAIKQTLAVGGNCSESPVELASNVDVLFTSLPLPKHLIDLMIKETALFTMMKKGSTLIDVSTIDPQTARLIANIAKENKINFLACPLGKGPAQAEEGTEPIFAGGDKEVYESFESMLNKIGDPVFYLGDVEQSTAFKLISNMIGMTNLVVMSEGLKLGIEAGIEPVLLKQLLHDTGADSYQLHLRAPWILNNDYDTRFSVNLALKDVRLGVGMAEYFKQSAPHVSLAVKHFEEAQKLGFGDEDCAAVYKIFEKEKVTEK